MSSWVFLPAMMPAMRAAPSTSPFLALPASTRSSVDVAITTWPSATATRSVAAFAETSTMRASPPAARWVRVRERATALLRGAEMAQLACEQLARRRLHVGLAHQALADQERLDADVREPRQIGRRRDAALAHQHAAGRNPR